MKPLQNNLSDNIIKRCKPLLGTYIQVEVKGQVNDKFLIEITNKIFSYLEKIQQLMSFHDKDSELTYINNHAYKETCQISTELAFVLNHALELSKLTMGAYDVTIAPLLSKAGILPKIKDRQIDQDANWQDITLNHHKISFNKKLYIDLGGIAKGYAVDYAFEKIDSLIKEYNLQVIINAGGDIKMNKWQDEEIAIKFPNLQSNKIFTLPMQNKAIATSANYYMQDSPENSAIISAISKEFIKNKYSVSIFAENCMIADSLTKIVFLQKNITQILAHYQSQSLIIDQQGKIVNNIADGSYN